jgi:hypothetical protein
MSFDRKKGDNFRQPYLKNKASDLIVGNQTKDEVLGSVATIDGEPYMAMEVYDNTEEGRKIAKARHQNMRVMSNFESRIKLVPVGDYLVIYTHLDDVRIGSSHTSKLARGY